MPDSSTATHTAHTSTVTSNNTDQAKSAISVPVMVTLALLAAMAPLATDLYLPAFPQMLQQFNTNAAGIQMTLTTFLVGAALGQLLFGPLSDRFGRLRPVIFGSIVCAIATVAAAVSPTVEILTISRLFQGLAASAGMVVGRAIISDMAPSSGEAARAFNIIMAIMGIAPITAPWLGSLLVGIVGWRGIFWVIFALASAAVLLVLAFLRESHPTENRSSRQPIQVKTFLNRTFVGYTLACAFGFGTLMAYISASSFLFQNIIGVSVIQYGLLFATNAFLLTATSGLSSFLSTRVPVQRLIFFGLGGLVAGSFCVAGFVFLNAPPFWTVFPIALVVASLGFVFGNATTLAIAAVPEALGTGSALLGALQFGFGAMVAPLVGIAGDHSAVPLALVMVVMSILTLVSCLIAVRGEQEG